MQKYYYLEEKELKKGFACVMEQAELPIKNYKEKFLELNLKVHEFIWEEGLLGLDRVFLDENTGEVRAATEQDKYMLDGEKYEIRNMNYIKDGEVKEKPSIPEEFKKPIFDETMEEWVESASLEELKIIKIKELEQARDFLIEAPLEVSGTKYLVNKQGYDDILGAITLSNIIEKKVRENIPEYVYEIKWTSYNGEEILLKSYDLENIALQFGMRKDAIYQEHRNKVTLAEKSLNIKNLNEIFMESINNRK